MKNRSFFMRAATVLACLCLVLTAAVTGTVAHYVSSTAGSDDISVATWELEVNDVNFATSYTGDEVVVTELAFGLFDTIYDTLGEPEEDLTANDLETQVSAGKIAPGTKGAFTFVIDNLSEVDAKYTLEFTETNASGIYIQYSLNNEDWVDDFTEINQNLDLTKDVLLAKETGTKTVTIYWRWCFDGGNGAHAGQTNGGDTSLGVLAQDEATRPSVTVTAKLTAVQVD